MDTSQQNSMFLARGPSYHFGPLRRRLWCCIVEQLLPRAELPVLTLLSGMEVLYVNTIIRSHRSRSPGVLFLFLKLLILAEPSDEAGMKAFGCWLGL